MDGQSVQGRARSNSDPSDPFTVPPSSPSLSRGFSRLSIDAPSISNFQESKPHPPPVRSGNESAQPSPRRSSVAPKSPRSPVLNRKASNSSFHRQDFGSSPKPPFGRTTSSSYSPRASQASSRPVQSTEPERKPRTAASVATDYFTKELVHHAQGAHNSDTTVIIHDSCYGHRYSRPKTSKTILSLIVERPERIQAGVLGVSCAYVRTGRRHAGGVDQAAPHPNHEPDASTIPFRILTSSRRVPLSSPFVTAVHGTKWMQDLKLMCDAAETKLASGEKELSRADTPTGAASATPQLHEGDLYLCPQSLEAFESALGGTCDAVDAVFQASGSPNACKKAFACVRPPGHHCSGEMPSGFCWINNVHVGIEYAAQQYGLTHAAIIDFDLHHGDGSQAITWERNTKAAKPQKAPAKNTAPAKRTSIGYFSLHDINSYPCEDGDMDKVQRASVCLENSHAQSIWNVHLQPWASEYEFWKLYETRYLVLLAKARNFLKLYTQRLKSANPTAQPRAAIFLSAGFDASEWETQSMQRHKVNVPTDFYARFTMDVVKLAAEEGTSVDGRIVSVLEGGYSDRALTSGIFSHISGLTCKHTPDSVREAAHSSPEPFVTVPQSARTWNPGWWSLTALEELETLHNPPPPAPIRKPRTNEPPTYTSPTQSYTAKVVDPSRIYRTTSGNSSTPAVSRAPSPPPPEVDWATSACALSKLLIPSDRQIDSCRHDELNAPRIKRERHSSIELPPAESTGGRMQTRGRKEKPDGEIAQGNVPRASLSNRRRTLSDLSSIAGDRKEGATNPSTNMSSASARPSTSGSDRPLSKDTSTSSRNSARSRQGVPSAAEAAPLQVNKSRRASGAKSMLGGSKVGTVPPPVPQVPREHSIKYEGGSTNGGVDGLTSGVKKITLKLTQDEGESPKKAPRKLPVPKAPKTAPAKPASAKAARATKAPSGKAAPTEAPAVPNATGKSDPGPGLQSHTVRAVAPSPTSNTAMPAGGLSDQPALETVSKSKYQGTSGSAPSQVPAASGSDPAGTHAAQYAPWQPQAASPTTVVTSHAGAEQSSPEFVPYNPGPHEREDKPKSTNFEQGEIQWLPPNSGTPAPGASKRGKENLPIFSASGHIPFAMGAAVGATSSASNLSTATFSEAGIQDGSADVPKMEKHDASVWDVPGTAHR